MHLDPEILDCSRTEFWNLLYKLLYRCILYISLEILDNIEAGTSMEHLVLLHEGYFRLYVLCKFWASNGI